MSAHVDPEEVVRLARLIARRKITRAAALRRLNAASFEVTAGPGPSAAEAELDAMLRRMANGPAL